MAIAPGTRFGPYEIDALIGEGGMGVVYRATDTNLNRAVAITVLPDAFVVDTERLARFQREAELERSHGTTGLIVELVDGLTLTERIGHGAIPVDEALLVAKQIAEAVEAAHEQGIVHRDLKPANINSAWLGFASDGKMRRVPIAGGLPVTICDLAGPGTWLNDGTIVFR